MALANIAEGISGGIDTANEILNKGVESTGKIVDLLKRTGSKIANVSNPVQVPVVTPSDRTQVLGVVGLFALLGVLLILLFRGGK